MADTPLRSNLDPAWRDLFALAATAEPELQRLFLAAITALADAVAVEALRRALAMNDPYAALEAIPTRLLAPSLAELTAVLEAVATDASRLALRRLVVPPQAGVPAEIALSLTGGLPTLPTQEIADWARSYGLQLAQDLSDETRKALQDIIASAVERGQAPAQTARLVEQMIGLNRRQAVALARYRDRLVGEGLSGAQVERLAGRYAAKLLRQRAVAIARTESLSAANAGRRAVWERNVSEGVIDPSRWWREWLAIMGDARTCERCEAMDGQRAEIGQPYMTPEGEEIMGPGLHSVCRCSEALVRR